MMDVKDKSLGFAAMQVKHGRKWKGMYWGVAMDGKIYDIQESGPTQFLVNSTDKREAEIYPNREAVIKMLTTPVATKKKKAAKTPPPVKETPLQKNKAKGAAAAKEEVVAQYKDFKVVSSPGKHTVTWKHADDYGGWFEGSRTFSNAAEANAFVVAMNKQALPKPGREILTLQKGIKELQEELTYRPEQEEYILQDIENIKLQIDELRQKGEPKGMRRSPTPTKTSKQESKRQEEFFDEPTEGDLPFTKEQADEQKKKWGDKHRELKNKIKNDPKRKQVVQLVKDLFKGTVSVREFLEKLKKVKPVSRKTIPKPRSPKIIGMAVDYANKALKGIVGLTRNIQSGTEVEVRVDIPPWNNYGIPVVTIKRAGSKEVDIGYGAAAALGKVAFNTDPHEALKIAMEERSKAPMGWLKGEWMNMTPEQIYDSMLKESNNPNSRWTQISMNPARHSYMYEVGRKGEIPSERPVIGASQVHMIGNTLMAKDVVYGDPMSEDFSPAKRMAAKKQKKKFSPMEQELKSKPDIRFKHKRTSDMESRLGLRKDGILKRYLRTDRGYNQAMAKAQDINRDLRRTNSPFVARITNIPGERGDNRTYHAVHLEPRPDVRFKHKPTNPERADIVQKIVDILNYKDLLEKDESMVKRTKITKEIKEEIRGWKNLIMSDFSYFGNDMPIGELKQILDELQELVEWGKEMRKLMEAERTKKNNKLKAQLGNMLKVEDDSNLPSDKRLNGEIDLKTADEIEAFLDIVSTLKRDTILIAKGKAYMRDDFLATFKPTSKIGKVEYMQPLDVNLANTKGTRTSNWSIWMPSSAKDFKTLLYQLYGKGNKGMAWFNKNVLSPLGVAYHNFGENKSKFENEWASLKKKHGFSKISEKMSGIKAANGIELTNNQVVYLYNVIKQPQLWTKLANGAIDNKTMNEIVDYMNTKASLKAYADELPGVFAKFREEVETKLDEVGLDTFPTHNYRKDVEQQIAFFQTAEGGNMTAAKAEATARANHDLISKIYGGEQNIPDDIPYFPIRVEAEEQGTITLNTFLDPNAQVNAMTVLTGNLITREKGGELVWWNTNSDIMAKQYMDGVLRSAAFVDWFKRMNAVFSTSNMRKIIANHGETYATELKRNLARIITNQRMPMGDEKGTWTAVNNWVNQSQALIMFVNQKSAMLQQLSSINFMLRNPMDYMAAMKNPWKMIKTMKYIWDSNYLKTRRGSGAGDMLMEDLIKYKATHKGLLASMFAMFMEKMFKFGYTPTRVMDSAAIMFGGAPYYIAQQKKHLEAIKKKEPGLPEAEAIEKANKQAMIDLQEESEEVQQSSRMDKISSQQAKTAGRFILAFANTPMQYQRKIFQAFSNLRHGRGSAARNFGTIVYYGALQNMLFSALQQASFLAFTGGDEDERDRAGAIEDEYAPLSFKERKHLYNTINSMANTMLRGSGYWGVGMAAFKDFLIEAYNQHGEGYKANYYKAGLRMLNMAPGISYKLQQLIRATRTLHYADSDQRSGAWAKYGENPYLRATTTAGGFFFNLQAEEALLFLEQFADIMAEQVDMTQKVGRALGYSRYQLDIKPWEWDGEEGDSDEPQIEYPTDSEPAQEEPAIEYPS